MQEEKDYLLKIINVNLDYFKKLCYDDTEKRDILWKLFTINSRKDLDKITLDEKLLENYRNKLNRLSGDKEYCRMVWDERIENNLRAFQEYEQGKSEGIEQNQKLVINNMLKEKLSLDMISKYLGLSKEEINRIISKD